MQINRLIHTRLDLSRKVQLSRALAFVLLLCGAALFKGCGEATINPSEPSVTPVDPANPFTEIQGKQWRLFLMIPDENGWVTPPQSAVYTIEFRNDSTCRGTVACDTFTAPYSGDKEGKQVDLIEPQTNGEKCQDGLSETYLELLRDATNYRLSATELELYFVDPSSNQERTLIFKEATDPLFKIKPVILNGGTDATSYSTGPFKLLDARIETAPPPQTGYILVVEVRYSGGCEEHTFDVRRSPIFSASLNTVALQISKNEVNDPCDSEITETLRFTLAPVETVIVRNLQQNPDGPETETTIVTVEGGVPTTKFTLQLPNE